mmetsp:Transcript_13495/g.37941  ORF Transcript_13495/g.37941 Transcript_13495/m.37941 type:complete len:111 (+) Transcript_13495:1365-1697(+)
MLIYDSYNAIHIICDIEGLSQYCTGHAVLCGTKGEIKPYKLMHVVPLRSMLPNHGIFRVLQPFGRFGAASCTSSSLPLPLPAYPHPSRSFAANRIPEVLVRPRNRPRRQF